WSPSLSWQQLLILTTLNLKGSPVFVDGDGRFQNGVAKILIELVWNPAFVRQFKYGRVGQIISGSERNSTRPALNNILEE
ncbi:hypothetical protein KIN20_004820, partial [Parelaphostrongylus tenuis]